jgi:hypothetical protein
VPKNQKVCRVMRSGSRVPGPPPRSAPYLTASAGERTAHPVAHEHKYLDGHQHDSHPQLQAARPVMPTMRTTIVDPAITT